MLRNLQNYTSSKKAGLGLKSRSDSETLHFFHFNKLHDAWYELLITSPYLQVTEHRNFLPKYPLILP